MGKIILCDIDINIEIGKICRMMKKKGHLR